MKSGIYIIRNIINNKIYIGSTTNFSKRWIMHKYKLYKQTHHSIRLQNSVNKYGIDNFSFEVIQYCNPEELIINEQYWMEFYDVYNKGYNCTPKAGNCLGIVVSQNTRLKQSLAKKGKPLSDKNKYKPNYFQKGGVPWNKGKKGKQIAWNKGMTGEQIAWNRKKIITFDGIVFNSISETSKYYGCSPSTIRRAINENKILSVQ